MCAFCTALPMTIAISAAAKAKERQDIKRAEETGEAPPERPLTANQVMALMFAGLVVAAVITHSLPGPGTAA